MTSWLQKSNDNGYKPTADDAVTAVKPSGAQTCSSKKRKFSETNETNHTKKPTYNKIFFATWFQLFNNKKQLASTTLFDL